MFGNLIQELDYWRYVCEHEEDGVEFEYAEQMFIDVLSSVKEMREVLLEDLNEYRIDCKVNNTPTDLGYWRIKKQLEESTFSLYSSR
jgi:hypothetical protein